MKEGARLVECVEDVVEELMPQLAQQTLPKPTEWAVSSKASSAPQMRIQQASAKLAGTSRTRDCDIKDGETSDVKMILQCLKDAGKLHVDSIIESSGLAAATVLKLLLELELRGSVVQHPGKLFSLTTS